MRPVTIRIGLTRKYAAHLCATVFIKKKKFLLTLSADVQVGMSVIDANDLSLFMLTTILLIFSFFISEEIVIVSWMTGVKVF